MPSFFPPSQSLLKKTVGLCLMSSTICFITPNASAQQDDLYAVGGIQLYQTARNNVVAKNTALIGGKKRAFKSMTCRLVVRPVCNNLAIDDGKLESVIRDFTIQNETFGQGVYQGILKVRFREKNFTELLEEKKLRYSTLQARPLLILPVWEEEGSNFMWSNQNRWLKYWAGRKQAGLVPVWGVRWNQQDRRTLPQIPASFDSYAPFEALVRNYKAGGVLVSRLRVERNSTGTITRMTLQSTLFHPDIGQSPGTLKITRKKDETEKDLLARTALLLTNNLEEKWKKQTEVASRKQNELKVVAVFSTQRQWHRIQKQLGAVKQIDRFAVDGLSIRMARLTMSFTVPQNQLTKALSLKGLNLKQEAGIGWQISLRS